MSEWKETTLAEVINIQNGYAFKSEDFDTQGIPVIKIKNIASGKMLLDDIQFYSKSLTGLDKFIVKENDILIAMTGSHVTQISSAVGKVTRYDSIHKSLLNQRVGKIFSVNTNQLNNDFLYYFLIQPTTQYQLGLKASGSANQANISPSNIKDMPILLPPISEQKSIADVLSCLDAKIENLRRQNETLEAIALTLFKHWFIDFEFPNADGKPYKSSGGAMSPSELGEIPEGWRVENLKNVMTLNYGKSLTAENRINGKYPVVGSNGIVDTHTEFFVNAPGIVIGRKGTIGKVIWIEENFYPIDTTFYIEDNLGCEGLYFHYFLLRNQNFNKLTSDSAVPGLNRDMAYSVEFAISSNTLINQYNSIAKTIFDKINNNKKQLQTLTKTRDTLLPKLMSGQLRIKE